MSHQSVPAGAYNVPAVTFKEVEPTNGKEKSTGSEWPQEAPYEEHYMTKSPIKQDRPFSEQKNLAPTVSVPPQYGNEHEAARDDAIARSEHIEDTKETNLLDPTVKDTRRRRLRRHCARYIICYCLGLLILLAILLPIIFLVIFPIIAQAIVNKQELLLWEASLLAPTPDSVIFKLNSTITIPRPFVVVLDKINMSLFIRGSDDDQPYTYLELAKSRLKGNASIIVEPQRTRIVDQGQWFKFLNETLYAEALTIAARGKTTGHFGAIKAKLTVDKNIRIKGFNKLKGFSVTGAQVLLPADQAGNNLKATLSLPNYSPVTLDLGNQSFSLKIGNLQVGQATVYNFLLTPGTNPETLIGTLDFLTIIENLEYILNTSSEALAQGNLRLLVSGTDTVFNGVHIPYYEKLLGGLVLEADIPVTQLLVGSLGGYLNNTAGGLQDLLDAIPAALLNGSISISQLQSTLLTAYANGTGSIQDIGAAVGNIFTEAGQLDVGGVLDAFGTAIGAITDGVATAGEIFGGITGSLGGAALTAGNIINALNLSALIPTPQPGPVIAAPTAA